MTEKGKRGSGNFQINPGLSKEIKMKLGESIDEKGVYLNIKLLKIKSN